MQMSEELRREVQMMELDILKEFQRICADHDLRYFAIGGTCLGAVRHKGFIPWDDDIDVAMPFEDYSRFQKIAGRELQEPYEIINPVEHRACTFPFIKMYRSDTAFIEKARENRPESYFGIFIDIMPIFGLPVDKKERDRVYRESSLYIRQNRFNRLSFAETKSVPQKLMWMTCVRGRASGDPCYYLKKLNALGQRCDFDAAQEILFAWRSIYYNKKKTYKRKFDKYVFRDYCELPFEDTVIRVPVEYDSYLTRDFGDYMKLPPEEKRVTVHPAAIIDLHKSCRAYAEEYRQHKKKA